MNAKTSLLLLTLVTTVGLSGPVTAAHLAPPQDPECSYASGMLNSHWDEVAHASRYSVQITAEYDLSGNGQMDRWQEFHFETDYPGLAISRDELDGTFYQDSVGVVEKDAMGVNVRIKSMHLGKGHEIGEGHEKALGKGHHKINGSVRNAEYSECKVAFSAPPTCRGFCR